jgi:hypothetical protein
MIHYSVYYRNSAGKCQDDFLTKGETLRHRKLWKKEGKGRLFDYEAFDSSDDAKPNLQEKNHFVDFYAKLLKNHPQISAKTQRNPGKKQWKLTIFSKTGKKP